MRLSREAEYGLRGLSYLARQDGSQSVRLSEIAEAEDLPPSFLAKTFQKLARNGLVVSNRGGTQRGYALARPPQAIRVREILEAIEGPGLFNRCIFWTHRCGEEHPCLLHHRWRHVRDLFVAVLERTTLADVIAADRPVVEAGTESLPGASARGSESWI